MLINKFLEHVTEEIYKDIYISSHLRLRCSDLVFNSISTEKKCGRTQWHYFSSESLQSKHKYEPNVLLCMLYIRLHITRDLLPVMCKGMSKIS